MQNISQLALSLGVHGPVLLAAIGAYYKYGDRSEIYAKSLSCTDDIVRELKRKIVDGLINAVDVIFIRNLNMPSIIVSANGRAADGVAYAERVPEVHRSEAFRDAVAGYMNGASKDLDDYRVVRSARAAWLAAMRWVSWSLLFLLSWQAVVCIGLVTLTFLSVSLRPLVACVLCIPTCLLVLAAIGGLGFALREHDTITKQRIQHEPI